MKAQEIKIKHIYYVDYEPTQKGEFGKKHLAVVLKEELSNEKYIYCKLYKDSIVNKMKQCYNTIRKSLLKVVGTLIPIK